MAKPTNVKAFMHGYYEIRAPYRFGVKFYCGEANYHFFIDDIDAFEDGDDNLAQIIASGTWDKGPTLYKNPLDSIKRGDPDYFETRKLDALSKANQEMILGALEEVRSKNLINEAIEEAKEEARRRLIEANERLTTSRIEKAAPRLLEILKATLPTLECAKRNAEHADNHSLAEHIGAIVTRASKLVDSLENHTQDDACSVLDDVCVVCHVLHAEPCQNCGGKAFHKPGCRDARRRRVAL